MSTLIDALKGLQSEMQQKLARDPVDSDLPTEHWEFRLASIIAEHEQSAGWRPIGSCPDDGETEVWLWQHGLGSAEIGTFDSCEFYRRNGMAFVDTPTHWQPLPKGPGEA